MSTRIYLIRHGESQNNQMDMLSGSQDVPMTERGVEQCKHLSKYFEHIAVDIVYTSNLLRAKQTGQLVFPPPHHQKHLIVENKDFREINYGVYEGFNRKEYDSSTDKIIKLWESKPSEIVFPKGDSVIGHAKNVLKALENIIRYNKTIAIVSHKTTIRLMLAQILGLDIDYFRNIPCKNCSVHGILFEHNKLKIDFINLTYK